MDRPAAYTLLKSLLQRLDADSRLEQPRMSGLVSATEKAALELLLKECDVSSPLDGHEARREALQTTGTDTRADEPQPRFTESMEGEIAHHTTPLRIDEKAFSFLKAQNSEIVLCLDFGTAKSKAFAA